MILREVFYGVTRFADIQADIGIPKAVLSKRLNHLLTIGVLVRKKYQEPNSRARHAYALTDSGTELAIPLIAMMLWGDKHQMPNLPKVKLVERKRKSPVRLALIDEQGQETPLDQIKLLMVEQELKPD